MIQRGDIRYKTPLLTINAPVSILTKLQDEMLMHRPCCVVGHAMKTASGAHAVPMMSCTYYASGLTSA